MQQEKAQKLLTKVKKLKKLLESKLKEYYTSPMSTKELMKTVLNDKELLNKVIKNSKQIIPGKTYLCITTAEGSDEIIATTMRIGQTVRKAYIGLHEPVTKNNVVKAIKGDMPEDY